MLHNCASHLFQIDVPIIHAFMEGVKNPKVALVSDPGSPVPSTLCSAARRPWLPAGLCPKSWKTNTTLLPIMGNIDLVAVACFLPFHFVGLSSEASWEKI